MIDNQKYHEFYKKKKTIVKLSIESFSLEQWKFDLNWVFLEIAVSIEIRFFSLKCMRTNYSNKNYDGKHK